MWQLKAFPQVPEGEVGSSRFFGGNSVLAFSFYPGNQAGVPGEGKAVADFIWFWN